jgi:hypothetical protein
MAIKHKYIHFKKKDSFLREEGNGNLLDSSIIFIQESREIVTHGTVYKTVNWGILESAVEPTEQTSVNGEDDGSVSEE